MAVLSKIRQKSVLLIVVIGLALLAFIVGDLVKGGGASSDSRNIGSVNGTDINTREFMNKVSQAEQRSQSRGPRVSKMVWDNEVKRILLDDEFEKLGLKIGKDQLINVIKENPNFANNPQFLNELGKFDVNKFNEFVHTMKQSSQEQWDSWLAFEREIEKVAIEQMYYSMISAGVNTTTLEAKNTYYTENKKVSFDYVTIPYSTINDDEVKVSDAEIESYIKRYESKFKADPSRKIEYIFVSNEPSEKDKEDVKESMSELLFPSIVYNPETNKNDSILGFKNTKNIEEFVNLKSDKKFDTIYYSKKDLPTEFQEDLFNLKEGEIFGPYLYEGYYNLARLADRKAGAKVKVAHILISHEGTEGPSPVNRTKEEAKELAESLLKEANSNPSKFGELALINSDDPGSKNNNGEYDDVSRGTMVPAFDNYIFNNAVGKVGIVETVFGYHVLKVVEKKEGVRLAIISRKIEASDATADEAYAKATKFEQEVASKDFGELAKEMNLDFQKDVNLIQYDEDLPTVGNQRPVVIWAFNKKTNVGEIKRFENIEGIVIAKLNFANDTGLNSVEDARETVEPILMNEKKAALIAPKMSGETLSQVSEKSNEALNSATEVNRTNPLIINIGNEPRVVGTAFGLKEGDISKPINGEKGVYVIQTKSFTSTPDLPNYTTYKNKTIRANRQLSQYKVINTLKDVAKIKDNRINIIQ